MDGLLSYLSPDEQRMAMQNARTQGLLSLGAALLQSSTGAPGQGKPRLGQILGQALPVGMQAYQGGIDQTLQQLLVGQRMQEMQRQREIRARQEQAQAQLAQMTQPVTPLTALSAPGRAGPTAERAETIGQVPQMTREQALRMAMNPDLPGPDREALFKYVEATKPVEPKLGPGKLGEYQAARASGDIPAGMTYPEFIAMNKPAGTSVTVPISVGTERKYGEALGTKIADEDVRLRDQAMGVPSQIETIRQSRDLLDKGNVFTGKFANQKLFAAAVGQSLGVTGKDTNELVANTQRLFANRAKATLDNVKASGLGAGQGFTDRDREFLEKAVLGNIEFSADSLKRQLEIEEKAARGVVDKWNSRLKQIPRAAVEGTGITPIEIPAAQRPKVLRYDPVKGRAE
jgi:hypothetical protein